MPYKQYIQWDAYYKQGSLKFITNPIFFNFSVFIVWKIDTQSKKKGRIIVDIWKLNKLLLFDSYFLLLQLEIITNV